MRDKTDTSMVESSEQGLPFFARFLEGQDRSKGPDRTLKFPSDSDEWVLFNSTTTDDDK